MKELNPAGRLLAPALMAYAAAAPGATSPQSAALTIDRLFDVPALAGPSLQGVRISPDGSRVTQTFDSLRRRTVLNDSTGRTTSAFDPTGRGVLMVTPAGLRVSYTFDAIGQRSYMIEPGGGRFSYTFDANGQITRAMVAPSTVVSISRRPPCCCTMRQHFDKPNPSPRPACRPEKNGSKACCRSASVKP